MKIEVVSALPHSTVHSAALSRRNRSIICAGPYEVLPLDTCYEPLPSTSSLSNCAIECLQLSNDERTIGLGIDTLVKIADVSSGREIRNLTGHSQTISSIAASKFSVYSWYTGSSDCSWVQWDTRMHPSKVLSARTNGVVRSVALSPGDRFIAVGTDHSIQLFDARQRQYVKQFNCSGHRLEFNPTEVLLSSVGHDRIVRFFCLETLEMISQSDPFLDDIQASAFDTHLMITSTNESINLMTWEPCDILTSVPLKNVEKVVNVSVNGGVELDFICIGETTERLEMRSYTIEELLSYSPSHELSGSIYEEDEELEENDNSPDSVDSSPTEEQKVSIVDENEMLSSESNSPSSNSSSALDSCQSTPNSPTKIPDKKVRSASQKTRTFSCPSARNVRATLEKPTKMTLRSVAPGSGKPPAKGQASTHTRSSSTTSKSSLRSNKPSPSLSDLRIKPLSHAGSTQSLSSEKGTTKSSLQKSRESITITYLGHPKSPTKTVNPTAKTTKTTTTARRNPSPALRDATRKASNVKTGPVGGFLEELNSINDHFAQTNKGLKTMKKILARKGFDGLLADNVKNDEQLMMTTLMSFNKSNEWSLQTCYAYLPILMDSILSSENNLRRVSLRSLEKIAISMPEKLVKFSNSQSRIGVDVAAEERAERSMFCIEKLREMCKKRDWYYKQLDETSIERLDAIFELLKTL